MQYTRIVLQIINYTNDRNRISSGMNPLERIDGKNRESSQDK